MITLSIYFQFKWIVILLFKYFKNLLIKTFKIKFNIVV